MMNRHKCKKTARAKNLKGSILKLLNYLKFYKSSFLFVLILATASNILSTLGPKILSKATNILTSEFLNQNSKKINISLLEINKILINAAIIYFLSLLLSILQSNIISDISSKIIYKLREDINRKFHCLPICYFDNNSHGDILSRMTNDVETINQTLSQNFIQITTAVVSIISMTIIIFTINIKLAFVTIFIVPISSLIIFLITKQTQKYFVKQQNYLGNINSKIQEDFENHVIIKSYNSETKTIKEFTKINNELYKNSWISNFFSSLLIPISQVISNIIYVFVCIYSFYLILKKEILIGDFQAFISYVRSFSQPVNQVSNIVNMIQQTAAASERIFEFLEQNEESKDIKDNLFFNSDLKKYIEFKNVNFSYSKNKKTIENLNLKIKSGQKVAIVGPTGSGKTTIMKLLMRFYDIDSGEILINKKNILLYKKSDLRNLFSMVMQDSWLFNGTILENISYPKRNVNLQQIKKATIDSQAHDFINKLKNKYQTIINEDSENISAGQKQLLNIARAFVANSEILILDEATSNIDNYTEKLIQKAINKLMTNKTCFIIAHRLSTIENADLILVINDGKIIEQGNHKQLIKNKKFYFDLYNSQFSSNN
ncbi:MAG: ABC transporter ATP-binding protein/permease [Clostridiales bacterium]|nr:ABC transporter ATP-binding protein/permease [Clostridiales bacterium]